jgi:hypothetical protein
MKKIAVLILCLMAVSAKAHREDPRPDRPSIQLALLLDTSNSMDGLIGQAKSQLWRVVNDLASAKCRGYAPRIEVALYEYGNSRLSAGESYLRQVLPFTNDLDRVSEKLFGLRTNGGEEYCGAVIKDAVRNLNWDNRDQVYKTIFIAGNEPFTQGNVDFRDAVQRAVDKGILVNTIFCGNRREGIETAWKDGAQRGRGDFLTINQDDQVAVLRTPYDDEIERLGRALNDTYVYYGSEGRQAHGIAGEWPTVPRSRWPRPAPPWNGRCLNQKTNTQSPLRAWMLSAKWPQAHWPPRRSKKGTCLKNTKTKTAKNWKRY